MRRLLTVVIGIGLGAGAGVLLARWFAPQTEQIKARLQQGWAETLDDARQASQQRKAELLADLEARRINTKAQGLKQTD